MKSVRIMAPIFGILVLAAGVRAQTIAGPWKASFETQIGVQSYTFEFAIEGTTLSGTASSVNGEDKIEEGKIEGDMISFVENMDYQGMPLRIVYTGTLEGDEIHFTRDVAGIAMEAFVATRPSGDEDDGDKAAEEQ